MTLAWVDLRELEGMQERVMTTSHPYGKAPLTSAPMPHLGGFNGWAIELDDASPQPHYATLKEIVPGAAHGWTPVPGEALQFARRQDAEAFAARYLMGQQVKVVGRNG